MYLTSVWINGALARIFLNGHGSQRIQRMDFRTSQRHSYRFRANPRSGRLPPPWWWYAHLASHRPSSHRRHHRVCCCRYDTGSVLLSTPVFDCRCWYNCCRQTDLLISVLKLYTSGSGFKRETIYFWSSLIEPKNPHPQTSTIQSPHPHRPRSSESFLIVLTIILSPWC